MNILARSWSAMTPERASAYMRTYGHPGESSKKLFLEVLADVGRGDDTRILEVGCGNGQIYESILATGTRPSYTGVDFSTVLLEDARRTFADDDRASWILDDANELGQVSGRFDVAVYSQVLEALAAPEDSLRRARDLAETTIIRFFEPPIHETDVCELREMEVGDGVVVPYLRRSMSRDYYRLILARLGCKRVDVYRDDATTHEVHVLHYR